MMTTEIALRQDARPQISEFMADVRAGLSADQKTLPCKYFYDEKGSRFFEAICRLDEYYLTRTETALLKSIRDDLATLIGPNAHIIEPGSGAGEKVRILLSALENPQSYIPVDISKEILQRSSREILENFRDIDIFPIARDFTRSLGIESVFTKNKNMGGGKKVIFFPGSTIGNFTPEEAQAFFETMRHSLDDGDGLLIGVDTVKDVDVLEAAYNDARGVTADFNKNLLARINRELGGNFVIENFVHQSIFNTDENRIEMHLISLKDQKVRIGNEVFSFARGETIHTENSYKYDPKDFSVLAQSAGFKPLKIWQDPDKLFSIHYLEAEKEQQS